MAYATGTATDPNDLLQKLVAFMESNGWTVDSSVADATTAWRAHLHKDGVYANFRTAINQQIAPGGNIGNAYGLAGYLGTGYSGAAAWHAQAGGPIADGQSYTVGQCLVLPSGAIVAYHFFCDASGDNFFICVERTAGIFGNLCFGTSLEKAGTWTGGPYFAGMASWFRMGSAHNFNALAPFTQWNLYSEYTLGHVRIDVDTFTNKWCAISGDAGNQTLPGSARGGYTGRLIASSDVANIGVLNPNILKVVDFQTRQYSAASGVLSLLPIRLWVARDTSGYSFIGTVPNVFIARSHPLAAGTELTIGADTYVIFPNVAVKKIT